MEQIFELPWPPANNHYYRNTKVGVRISEPGRKYMKSVRDSVLIQGVSCFGDYRLSVVIDAFPPDLRRRDLDGLPKGVLDSLTKAGVWEDDSQIDDLRIRRGKKCPPGYLLVKVKVIEDERQ